MIKEIVKQRIENTFDKLEKDSSLLTIVYANLEQFKKEKKLHNKYLKQWDNVLKLTLIEKKILTMLAL